MFEVKIILGENSYPLKIRSKIVSDAQDYFNKLDADMNKGWKMSKSWVDNPNQVQRCQIVADRLFTSVHLGKKAFIEKYGTEQQLEKNMRERIEEWEIIQADIF